MKWNTFPPKNNDVPWTKWFAWHSVSTGNFTGDKVWLEFVERKVFYPYDFTYSGSFYIYREIKYYDKKNR